MEEITWEDFERVELLAGTVISAQPFPKARRPAYIIHADLAQKLVC